MGEPLGGLHGGGQRTLRDSPPRVTIKEATEEESGTSGSISRGREPVAFFKVTVSPGG